MTGLKDTIYNWLLDVNIIDIVAEVIVQAIFVSLWILIGLLSIKFSKITIFRVLRVKDDDTRAITVAKLISSITKYIIWFVMFVVILSELNVSVTPFLASAGIIGVVIGFGSQEIVRDFISGFFIISENIFDIGDTIEIGGFKGEVIDISLRTTRIVSYKGETKTVNNGDVKNVVNYSKNKSLAIVDFGVSYETDLLKLRALMKEFVLTLKPKYKSIVSEAEFLGVVELSDSQITMRIIAKTETLKHYHIERSIREDLVEFLNKNNVNIPYPQVVIHNA